MLISPFKKQMFVAMSPMLAALSVGGAVAFPTVLLHQLQAKDSSIQLDFETASWVGAIHGFAGIPSIFLPLIMQWRGRKFAFILACLITLAGWILAFTATGATSILVCESFHGFGTNTILAVSCSSITEMITPKNRHTYIHIYAFLQSFAMSISILMSHYLHWKVISWIMCIPIVAALAVACAWPESPHWLAYRGDYDACAKAFVWLRGTDKESNKELEELVLAQKENSKTRGTAKSFKTLVSKITRRDFFLPILHLLTLQFLFYWSGCVVIIIYSIEIIKRCTQNDETAFIGGVVMNVVLGIGLCVSIFLNRYFDKKSILICCTSISVVNLLFTALISYLQAADYLAKTSSICLYSLIVFMFITGIGIIPLTYNMCIEIMPVKHRGIGGGILVVYSCILHSMTLKLAPYLFFYMDMWGTFLLYAFNAAWSCFVIWKFVPKTKDRTLQEVEDYYNFGSFGKRRDLSGLEACESIKGQIEEKPLNAS